MLNVVAQPIKIEEIMQRTYKIGRIIYEPKQSIKYGVIKHENTAGTAVAVYESALMFLSKYEDSKAFIEFTEA